MKQLILSTRTGKYETVAVPAPQAMPGHVLVRVRASVVSPGTEKVVLSFAEKNLAQKAYSRPDLVKQVWQKVEREGLLTTLDAVRNRLDQPMALGYSCAGEVIGVGASVTGFSVGNIVACAGGGYASHAEVASVPVNLCANLTAFCPDPATPLIETSAFAALGGIALHGVRLAELRLGETAAVIGLGLLGQIAVQLLKAAGCRVIGMDIASHRAELARRLGADAVASSASDMQELVSHFSAGKGADAVLITAATSNDEPLHLAAEIARDRAIIVPVGAVGLNVPRKIFYEKELDLRISRSYGPGRYDPEYEEEGKDYPIGYVRWTENRNMLAFLQFAAEGKLDLQPLITHRFSIEDAAKAYDLLLGKSDERFLAILLVYPNTGADAAERTVRIPMAASAVRTSQADKAMVGLIGAGLFATATLLPILKRTPGVRLVGVATKTGITGRHSADAYGFSYCTTDEDQLLGDSSINTVFILTRHHLHAPQVVRALDAGKHVFVEKPLALHEYEMDAIAEAVNRHPGQVLMVGFNRRFSWLAQEMKKFIGQAREPLVLHYRINAGFIPASHWVHDPVEGGGRILGEGCHFIDFANWMVGEAATDVSARVLPDNGRYVGDNAVIQLAYPNGSLAVITYLANSDRCIGKERVEVHTSGRSAVLEDFWTLELASGGRRSKRRQWFRQDKGHRGECAAFVAAIQDRGPAPISFNDLYTSTSATFAAVESLRSGRTVTVRTQPRSDSGKALLTAAQI